LYTQPLRSHFILYTTHAWELLSFNPFILAKGGRKRSSPSPIEESTCNPRRWRVCSFSFQEVPENLEFPFESGNFNIASAMTLWELLPSPLFLKSYRLTPAKELIVTPMHVILPANLSVFACFV